MIHCSWILEIDFSGNSSSYSIAKKLRHKSWMTVTRGVLHSPWYKTLRGSFFLDINVQELRQMHRLPWNMLWIIIDYIRVQYICTYGKPYTQIYGWCIKINAEIHKIYCQGNRSIRWNARTKLGLFAKELLAKFHQDPAPGLYKFPLVRVKYWKKKRSINSRERIIIVQRMAQKGEN